MVTDAVGIALTIGLNQKEFGFWGGIPPHFFST